MKEADKNLLLSKRKELHLKLQAGDYVKSGIAYHWLDYFKTIQDLGIFYEIDYLCYGTGAETPYVKNAIFALNEPALLPEMVIPSPGRIREKILQLYPSVSDFKYVMNLPLLDEYNQDAGAMLRKAGCILGCNSGQVYFFSTDASPVVRLQWDDLLQNANSIFDDSIISLVFMDLSQQWIIFRSIENEWRAGFIKGL